ncbi:XRE family transcriptional regulator [Streptomyces halstedii]|uniref:XRE family transcriptional regulator n=1 Tax=Streptomyces halstedii TaxID=1944 RepID=A0A6N9UAY8_STRHA|nr:XRE family transcriptional regulator [Streptomyces halstedii]NEA19852.1 XRE family transcriptional regulator [Streptomyces halstedii]
MLYDRTRLRAAAAKRGDQGFDQVRARLGVSRATAYRLWTGRGEPRARTAAAIHREYGLHAHELVEQATA